MKDRIDIILKESTLDKSNRIIKNVLIHRNKSANGYEYSLEAMQDIARLAEGVKIFLDHSYFADEVRKMGDLIGKYENVVLSAEGTEVRGDAKLLDTDYLKTIYSAVESMPEAFGSSIVGRVIFNEEGTIILNVTELLSADFVTRPATTKGIFESVQTMEAKMNEKELKERLDKLEEMNKKLTTENTELKSAMAKETRKNLIDKILTEHKVDKAKLSKQFIKILESVESVEDIEIIVKDLVSVKQDDVKLDMNPMFRKESAEDIETSDNTVSEADLNTFKKYCK